jgi:ABC-type branched-subunit amino acid transport system substrate-binding protein
MNGRLRIGACLSLSGRFAQFGRQAAQGLETWCSLDGAAEILVEDDCSDRRTLERVLPNVAARCDILLGPYSTQLMRAAGRMAAESGWLVWNQGGSGDDVEGAHPGNVVSVLTPTSRYAEPFLRRLAGEPGERRDLCIVHGPGSFGRQVADGADAIARQLGIRAISVAADSQIPPPGISADWDLFSAGVFEQDAELVSKVLRSAAPPRQVCAIAAGVREFGRVGDDTDGVFGIAQWFPGSRHDVALGPAEDEFLSAYTGQAGSAPDYPAVQAAAGAVIATSCARLAGGTSRDALWAAAAELETSTLFGGFKIDPGSGAQVKHQTVLVRWVDGELVQESQRHERRTELTDAAAGGAMQGSQRSCIRADGSGLDI